MAPNSSLANLIESFESIPEDVRSALLTIIQYGCHPEQVQRWYIIVREHYGADAPPPPGNLYEHEIVLTPVSRPAEAVRPALRSNNGPSPTERNHLGLGLDLDSLAKGQHVTSEQHHQTPVSSRALAAPIMSPASTSSRPGSAGSSVIMLPPAATTPQATLGLQSNAVLSTPNTDTFTFAVPGFRVNPANFPATPLQMGRDLSLGVSALSPNIHGFEMNAGDLATGFSMPLDASSVPVLPVNPIVFSDASVGALTPTDWYTPPPNHQHHSHHPSPEPASKRQRLTSNVGANASNDFKEPQQPRQARRPVPIKPSTKQQQQPRPNALQSPRTPPTHKQQAQQQPAFISPAPQMSYQTPPQGMIATSPGHFQQHQQFHQPLPHTPSSYPPAHMIPQSPLNMVPQSPSQPHYQQHPQQNLISPSTTSLSMIRTPTQSSAPPFPSLSLQPQMGHLQQPQTQQNQRKRHHHQMAEQHDQRPHHDRSHQQPSAMLPEQAHMHAARPNFIPLSEFSGFPPFELQHVPRSA